MLKRLHGARTRRTESFKGTVARATAGVACLCVVSAAAALGALPSSGAVASEAGASPSPGTVRVFPSVPVQGDTLIVLVSVPTGTAVVVITFDGGAVAAYPIPGGEFRALIGTDPEVPAGPHAIDAVVREAGGAVRRLTQTVRLAPGRFRVLQLTLPPTTSGLVTPQNLAIESRVLVPVLNRHTPTALWEGTFAVPSGGRINSPYAYGEQGVYNGLREWWHGGVDFAAPEGAPVSAANAGVVVLARSLPLGGNTIVIDHGQGVLSEYLHLSAFAVGEGARVQRGVLIGRVGATGFAPGLGLHWGLYVNGVPVNPLFWTVSRPELTAP